MSTLTGLPEIQERPTGYADGPVPTYQHQWEYDQLARLYRQRKPRRVLEIGTFHGGTLHLWLTHAAPRCLVVAVDTYAVGVDNRPLYPDWTKRSTILHVIEGDSHAPETIGRVGTFAPYDWIFIDAAHYFADCLADWANFRPMAAPGAVVVFHDLLTAPNHPEIQVDQLWDQIRRAGYLTQEIVANPDSDWGGIGVVYLD